MYWTEFEENYPEEVKQQVKSRKMKEKCVVQPFCPRSLKEDTDGVKRLWEKKTQCHWQEAGSSRHFGLPSCYRRHLSSNLTQDLHRGDLEARVGDIPCHSHQYSSAFLKHRRSRGAARGVHPRDSSIIIFIVAVVVVVVFVVSAVGFYSQRGVALLSRTDIPAKTFRSRVLWINWICANRFPLFLLVTLHLQTLISSLIHTHVHVHTYTITHTKSLDKKHSTHSQIKHEKPQQPSS